ISPAARLTLGAIQSVNSTSSTFKPCLPASATAASRGIAKAAGGPTFSGVSAANSVELNNPKARARALTGWDNRVFFIGSFQCVGASLLAKNLRALRGIRGPALSLTILASEL